MPNISDKFNTWKLHEKLPPHITIFYPFSAENIEPVVNFLKNWSHNQKVSGKFEILDFDHFDDKVVFAKVEADLLVMEMVEELRRSLNWHPHATLANKLSPQEINKILNYVLELEKPNFAIPFDNVTIFRFEGDRKWIVDQFFKFS